MNLEERIQSDLVAAMKAGDAAQRDTLRLAKTAIKNESVAQTRPLNDTEVEIVLARMVKQLNQAAEEYRVAGNADRAASELAEAELIKTYLPSPLSDSELGALVDAAISASGATSPQEMGQVMTALKPQVGTRADGATLAALVRSKLTA